MALSVLYLRTESETEQSPKTNMESLRSICDREVPIKQHKIDSFTVSFPSSFLSIKALALDTAQNHAKLAKIKANLIEAEDDLVKVLAEKIRKEAKQITTRDSISAIKSRVEELERTVQFQRARRDEYEAIISQQSLDDYKLLRDGFMFMLCQKLKSGQSMKMKKMEKFKNLFHGVKFKFNGINVKILKQEYSFTIYLANDAYSLWDCNPNLNGIKELINELNRTNGLFKFARIMRKRFQEAAALGLQPESTSFHQDSSTISVSGPASVSIERSISSAKKNERHLPLQDVNRQFKKVYHESKSPTVINESQIYDEEFNRHPKKVTKSDIFSTPVRQSPRLKAKK